MDAEEFSDDFIKEIQKKWIYSEVIQMRFFQITEGYNKGMLITRQEKRKDELTVDTDK